VAFRVPKTPLRGFPEAFESIRWKIDGEGVPKTLVLETLTAVSRLEKKPRQARRCNDPMFSQLTRAREDNRQIGEQGELRGSRLAKLADLFMRYSH
jgi:hypothetical protein